MIPQKVIDEIRERTDIVKVIGSVIELKRTGNNYKALCPFHNEKTPSFVVSPDKQIYHCFGCGKGGNVFNFIMDYEGVGFIEAVRKLGKEINIDVDKYITSGERGERLEPFYRAVEFASRFYNHLLLEDSRGAGALKYLEGRGIHNELIDEFTIGFAPSSWDELYRKAMDEGIDRNTLLESSLVIRQRGGTGYRDYFRNRVIFPIQSISNRFIALAGRVMDDSQPKYLNSAESPVYSKRRVLYGLSHSKDDIRKSKTAIIVEGYMDYLTLWNKGLRNVVAVCGTSFTSDQAYVLARYANRVYIINDGDRAGIRAAVRTADVLITKGLEARVVILPEGEDPDSFVRKRGAEGLEDEMASAPDYFRYLKLESEKGSGSIARKDQVIRHLIETVSRVDDRVKKELYLQEVSDLFGVSIDALRSGLKNSKGSRDFGSSSKPRGSRNERVQKEIFRISMESKRFAEMVITNIDADDLNGDDFKGYYKALDYALKNDIDIKSSEFIAGLTDPEVSRLASEIALMSLPPGPSDSVLRDDLLWMKKSSLKRELRMMKERIEELQKTQGKDTTEEEVELAEAYRKVSRELKKLSLKEGN